MSTFVSFTFRTKDGIYGGDGDIVWGNFEIRNVDDIKQFKAGVAEDLKKETGLDYTVVIRWWKEIE